MLALTLFVIYFCVASLLIYEPDPKVVKTARPSEDTSFDDFYRSIKEAIGPEEAPTGAEEAAPWEIAPPPMAEPLPEPKPKASHFSIQKLRRMASEQGLQHLLGKPLNRCRKEELMAVLFA